MWTHRSTIQIGSTRRQQEFLFRRLFQKNDLLGLSSSILRNSSTSSSNESYKHSTKDAATKNCPPRSRRMASTTSSKMNHETAQLILLRHGQSVWNKIPTFTGWCDVELTKQGREEAEAAGKLLWERGYDHFDHVVTSELQRAYQTCQLSLDAMGTIMGQQQEPQTRIQQAWQLNERHYGALQGRAKKDPSLARAYGTEQLTAWRREFYGRPPPMEMNHPYYQPPPAPLTESLADCQARVVEYWHEAMVPHMRPGQKVLVVAHSNTLRGLIAYLDEIAPENIPHIHVPNSVPCLYHVNATTGLATHGTYTSSGSKAHWLLDPENQQRLMAKVGADSETFARSVFDAWDESGDGYLQRQELADGLFTWKRSSDKALSALSGKLLEELNQGSLTTPLSMKQFQEMTLRGIRKHHLPFFEDEASSTTEQDVEQAAA